MGQLLLKSLTRCYVNNIVYLIILLSIKMFIILVALSALALLDCQSKFISLSRTLSVIW